MLKVNRIAYLSLLRRVRKVIGDKKEPIESVVEKNQIKYEQVLLPGSDRNLTSLNQLQKEILTKNQFNLMNPTLQPTTQKINTYIGINQQLTEINLGQIRIKNSNEVFLSEVDPYNIPENYDIKFNKSKILTIVGKRIHPTQGTTSIKTTNSPQNMKIDNHSFEEKTYEELTEKYVGYGLKYKFNVKEYFRYLLFALPLSFLTIFPFLDTIIEVILCLKSIKTIEQSSVKQIQKIKKKHLHKAILSSDIFQ